MGMFNQSFAGRCQWSNLRLGDCSIRIAVVTVLAIALAGCGTLRGMRCTEIGAQQSAAVSSVVSGAAHTVQCMSWGFDTPEIVVDIGAGKSRSVPETEGTQ